MKNRNLVLLLACCFLFAPVKAQEVDSSNLKIVKINCPDSVGYITNLGGLSQACQFYFTKEEKPNIFYVEDFSHDDFYNLVYKDDKSKISRVKLVLENYTPSVHDFIYCYNNSNHLLFYYILKDQHEEQELAQ